jgi:hypothetical protein
LAVRAGEATGTTILSAFLLRQCSQVADEAIPAIVFIGWLYILIGIAKSFVTGPLFDPFRPRKERFRCLNFFRRGFSGFWPV